MAAWLLAKVTWHLTLGRQGWGETHYYFSPTTATPLANIITDIGGYSRRRKPLMGNDCTMDGVSISFATADMMSPTAGQFLPGKPILYDRQGPFVTTWPSYGLGTAADKAEDPWTAIVSRLFGQNGYLARTWTMRGAPAVFLPYNPGNPAVPEFPPAPFSTVWTELKNYLLLAGTGGTRYGFMTKSRDPDISPVYSILKVTRDDTIENPPFRYWFVGGTPTSWAPGQLVTIKNVRGPGLKGASGTTRIVTKTSDYIETTKKQCEDCEIEYTAKSGNGRIVVYVFQPYTGGQYERTSEHLTGLPATKTRGRKGKGGACCK